MKDKLDFLIIGAQKAGTTSLYRYLKDHPEVAMPRDKEAPFFCWDEAWQQTGFERYLANISKQMVADPSRKWGTATPQYMSGGVYQSPEEPDKGYDERTVPERIREQLPDVRLVAILRDPVQRALAAHREAVTIGHDRRYFDDAIAQLLRPEALERARRRPEHMETGYVVWGEYGRILAGYFDVFPREQMLVLFTDELARDPVEVMERIERFIGVSTEHELPSTGEKFNSGVAVRRFSWSRPSTWASPYSPVSPQGVQVALRHNPVARAVWNVLPARTRRRVRDPYRRFEERLVSANRRDEGDLYSPATLERLREHYAEDTGRLTALLGTPPPWAEVAAPA